MTKKKISLYKLAKYTNLEIVMEAQVQSTGANQSKLMEKYKKNQKSIKKQAIGLKFAYGFLLTIITLIPIINYLNLIEFFGGSSPNVNAGLFAGSLILSVFFAMQIGYILIIGMMSVSALMTGEAFRWFETLPLSKDRLNKLGFLTVFRNVDVGLILVSLAFPITMLILTQSILLFFVSLLISIINVVFAFSILVIVSQRLSRVFRIQEINTKRATTIRLITMLGYFILIFSMSIFLNIALSSIDNFYALATSLDNTETINVIFSLIPFPFSPSFLLTMCIEPTRFSSLQWVIALMGLFLYGTISWLLYRRAVKAMRSVTSSSSIEIKSGRKVDEEIVVKVEKRTPIKAYIRKDLSMATKDIQMLMFILMPIVLPLIMVLTITGVASSDGTSEIAGDFMIIWSIIVIYFPIIAIMLVSGFLNVEDSGASVLASLPLNPRDQMKAKLILMIGIQLISYFLPIIVLLMNPAFVPFIGLFIAWYPIVLVFLMVMFQMKLRLLGRCKYKYVLEEVNIQHKVWKWVFLLSTQFLICIGFIVIGSMLLVFFNMLVMTVTLLIISLVSLSILFVTLNLMFPKEFGKRKMIGIRATFRKHPLLGTVILLITYFCFFYIPEFVLLPFTLLIEMLPIMVRILISVLVSFGIIGLFWLYIVPKGFRLPNDDETFSDFTKSIRLTGRHLIRNILIGVGVSLIVFLSVFIFGNIFGTHIWDLDVILGEPLTSPGYGWFIFILMLIPGIWEEVSFRGVITSLNEKRYSQKITLVIVSVLFGLFHLTNLIAGIPAILVIPQVFYAGLLGFIFGYMVIRTNSLIPGIVAHYLINSVGQLFLYITVADEISLVLFLIIGLGIVPAIFGIVFVWFVTPSKKRETIDI
ncbi:MAG: CPBP family glutamic-type intramembrane protease [Promethearchaeota archaeon]